MSVFAEPLAQVRGGIQPPHAANNRHEYKQALAALDLIEQRATDMEKALRDLAEHGTRFDTNPTVRWPTSDIHFWWVQRATEMDKAVRERARAALSAREEAQT